MDGVYTIEEIKSIVTPIAAAHDVDRIYLFGSYARGEATASSDIDLRVDKGRLKGLFALGHCMRIWRTAWVRSWILLPPAAFSKYPQQDPRPGSLPAFSGIGG